MHGASVDVLVACVLVLVVGLVRARASRRVLTAASLTLLAMCAQGVLGYVQYFEQIPAVLVGFHVFGAVIVFIAVQQLQFEVSPLGVTYVESPRDGARSERESRAAMSRA